MSGFAAKLFSAVDRLGHPAVVGLDPRLDHLPEPFRSRAAGDASAAADALIDYHRALIEILVGRVAAIKPQAAFFEMLGEQGWRALADAIRFAKERSLLVILDAKRGDIGSTSAAYAEALLGGGYGEGFPACDALTVNPYLGEDAMTPFLETARRMNSGLFVLVKTSNPGASLFQDYGKPPLADHVAETVHRWGQDRIDESGWSSIGAVVGATRPDELAHFRRLMPQTPILLPGYGFQGGGAQGLAPAFDSRGHGAVVNASRSILWAHERDDLAGLSTWEARTEAAVQEMIDDLGLRPTPSA